MPAIISFLVIIALLIFWQASRRRATLGLPGGRVVYTDTSDWLGVDDPLYDPVWDLTGKPDYLIHQGKTIIPVEVKSGRTPAAPYNSHIFQLAAYCLLVEQVFGVRPTHGLIRYAQRTFAIDYTAALESELKSLLEELRTFRRKRNVQRSHESPGRCRRCGYQSVCEESL